MEDFGPVYEVTHTVDRDIVADFDAWQREHIEAMLTIPGISRAIAYVADDAEDGRPRRVAKYFFDSDADLDRYLEGPATAMRQSASRHFDDRFSVERRLLRRSIDIDENGSAVESCLNCDTLLTGQYCGHCGQRSQSRLISLWELLKDAFGDLFELDSRVWRTIIPLSVRPGALTKDYLSGRRARFMPPFRTYLVLSIVFFLIASFNPREQFGLFFDDSVPAPAAGNQSPALPENSEEVAPGVATDLSPDELTEETERCEDFNVDGDLPPLLASWLTEERMKTACERIVGDDGKALGNKVLDNVPAALVALLPLMALILKLLYPLSKRYYVEHVLFVVHFHAFMFLILSLQLLLSRLAPVLGIPGAISTVADVAVFFYVPIYLYKSLRRVYEQRWYVTLSKYLILVICYLVGLALILAITAAFAALTI